MITATYQGSGYYRIFCPSCGEPHYFFVPLGATWTNQKCWYCDQIMKGNQISDGMPALNGVSSGGLLNRGDARNTQLKKLL